MLATVAQSAVENCVATAPLPLFPLVAEIVAVDVSCPVALKVTGVKLPSDTVTDWLPKGIPRVQFTEVCPLEFVAAGVLTEPLPLPVAKVMVWPLIGLPDWSTIWTTNGAESVAFVPPV